MGRPIHANAAATRIRIRESAVKLFAVQGEAATSTREIAREAQVSLAMVNHYFGSKSGLYSACVDAMYDELAEASARLEAALKNTHSPSMILETAVRECFQLARERRDAIRLILRKMLNDGELDPRRREETLLPFLETASTLLSGVTNRPPEELRLPLQSLVYLIVRHALNTNEELRLITGCADSPQQAVLDHLIDTAHRLVLTPPLEASS
jgi:AcrR family transcriptional regulator